MKSIATPKSCDVREFQNPEHPFLVAENDALAILSRGACLGYLVPVAFIEEQEIETIDAIYPTLVSVYGSTTTF